MLPPPISSGFSRSERRRIKSTWGLILLLTGIVCYSKKEFPSLRQALAFSISPNSQLRYFSDKSASHNRYRTHEISFLYNPKMATSQAEEGSDSTSSKRQKTMHNRSFASQEEEEVDPFLTRIPETVLANISTGNNKKSPASSKSLSLPSKLAYPFWYDPHPIAKWAAEILKGKLPPYNNGKPGTNSEETRAPLHALGKMYGVLVVSINEKKNNDCAPTNQPSEKIGYLQAYSGTMPRPKYGENITQQTDAVFVPLVFDRFAKITEEDGGDGFDYERDEEILNSLTREIELLQSCPERKKQKELWKESKTKLQQEISVAKKLQKSNKRDRKARRNAARAKLLSDNNNSLCSGFKNDKEAHMCFLEYNEEYRNLEDRLVQESALDQRKFKALKAKIEKELETVENALEEHRSQIEDLKRKHKDGSNEIQQKLFDHYKLLNVHGETKTLVEIFKDTPLKVPPSGTGDCAAIKLFQHAFSKGYRPVALAEFWWGPSPHTSERDVARTHGNYYPCCRGKSEPILSRHMLLGTDVELDPLMEGLNLRPNPQDEQSERKLSIIFEDEWLVVIDKPENVLSVPGRNVQDSIKTDLQKRYPNATGPILVHRLDYSTSGLLLAAKDSNTHKLLQAQFINRTVKKRYTALLEGDLLDETRTEIRGSVDLPLAGDYLNRPMQKVERGPEGKHALTFYEIIKWSGEKTQASQTRTRIHFYPQTGRTHQLRVHASHPEGLGMAIVGDDIYGKRDKRLCLHAGFLEINHPHTNQRVAFEAQVPF